MREVEPVVTVLMNPQDAADHPDGTFGGHPIVPDPAMPEGWARFKTELPSDVAAQPPKVPYFDAADLRARGAASAGTGNPTTETSLERSSWPRALSRLRSANRPSRRSRTPNLAA